MKTTIMTEKIKRRGIQLPENYRPDELELKTVSEIAREVGEGSVLTATSDESIAEILERMKQSDDGFSRQTVVPVLSGPFAIGIVIKEKLYRATHPIGNVCSLVEDQMFTVYPDNTLGVALETMLKSRQPVLPVVERDTQRVVGMITEWDILQVFERRFIEDKRIHQHISIKRKAIRFVRNRGRGR